MKTLSQLTAKENDRISKYIEDLDKIIDEFTDIHSLELVNKKSLTFKVAIEPEMQTIIQRHVTSHGFDNYVDDTGIHFNCTPKRDNL